MPDKIYGDIEVFGVVTIGAPTSGEGGKYTMPYRKGALGTMLGIDVAPTATGLTETIPQWVSPTAAPFNLVTADMVSSLIDVGITGGTGIEVTEVSHNQFIISLYVDFTPSMSVSPNSIEVGQSITGCTLNWSYNPPKNIVSQSINQGIGLVLPNTIRTIPYTNQISSSIPFTLTASDGTTTKNATATISLQRRRYWGTFAADSMLTSGDVLALSYELAATRNKTLILSPSGSRVVYAYPKVFGLSTVRDGNGSIIQDWYDGDGTGSVSPYEVSVANPYGITELYYVYQSNNQYNGTPTFVFG